MITATQCRCARTLLRWSVSKLSSAASVSQCDIDDFELERREPSAITADAIRRALTGRRHAADRLVGRLPGPRRVSGSIPVVSALIEELRFAMDSPVEGGVSCELVSENAQIPC